MSSLDSKWMWLVEWRTKRDAHIWLIDELLLSTRTKYQKVELLKTAGGLRLVLDGKTQSTEEDEWIYHEALVHPAMVLHEKPEDVLIIGGGEGATLREVLKHTTVRRVVMVDIDGELIEIAKRHLVKWHKGSFEDPRVKLVISDGRKFIEREESDTYDVIIMDLTDPTKDSPSRYLYTLEFYKEVKRVLKPRGIMVTQAASPYYAGKVSARIYFTLKSVFKVVRFYMAYVPQFLAPWGFAISSEGPDPLTLSKDEVDKRLKIRLKGKLKYYDGETHEGIFKLPKYVREELGEEIPPSTDEDPVYLPV
ncbi:MAG: spermidine synthase [Thermofilum sp. ex4484_15]|nr:MAG: spermidine synthase [Thermofilum sp. ex4484_15]